MINLHRLETKIRTALPRLADADKDYVLDVKAQMANHGMPLAHIAKSQVVLPTIEITIADLLQYLGGEIYMSGNGCIYRDYRELEDGCEICKWDLTLPLSGQSEDTITFLNNIK